MHVRAYIPNAKDVHESKALFHILDDGDGTVTLEAEESRCLAPKSRLTVSCNAKWKSIFISSGGSLLFVQRILVSRDVC